MFYEILLCDKQTPSNVCFVVMSTNFDREPQRQTHEDAVVGRKSSVDPTNSKYTNSSKPSEEGIFQRVKINETEVLT